ncbi:MAG: type 4a pilus biogenesis protein PilO [Actinobacteria bacterium]|nr:type 4a pilus biogenesis protein PilO [Actinomycetota bacterium]
MTRQNAILSVLGVVLVLVLFYFFAFQPKNEEIAVIREEIDTAVAQQATLESRIAALQEVRLRAPEIEAALAAAESIIPRESALPSALRQLQLAADDSGVDLITISPGRPTVVEGAAPELALMTISVAIEGSYFQLVDFLRRIEDPAITPRGIEWNSGSLAPTVYPRLTVSLSGEMYALLPAAPVPVEEAPVPTETPVPVETEPAA